MSTCLNPFEFRAGLERRWIWQKWQPRLNPFEFRAGLEPIEGFDSWDGVMS